jgi:hypothetical protein
MVKCDERISVLSCQKMKIQEGAFFIFSGQRVRGASPHFTIIAAFDAGGHQPHVLSDVAPAHRVCP